MANTLNYVDYDIESAILQLETFLKTTAWKDTYQSSTGEMIIQLCAAILNHIMYYIERSAEENYINTANLRSRVLNLVSLLNYKPARKISATGVDALVFTLSEASSYTVYIPKYTECQTTDGTKFLVNEDAAISAGGTTLSVDGIQGELIEQEFTSDGSISQEIEIDDNAVENTNYNLYVDDVLWTEVTTFIDSELDSKHYRIINQLDDTLLIVFGDGVHGFIPNNGSTIRFKYIRSAGLDGNVYQNDKITQINDAIYDSSGAVVSNISVTNSDSFNGGDNEQDTEEIRNVAPKVFATGDRAVTKEDFRAILLNYPSIAEALAWGEAEDSTLAVPSLYNTVRLCVVLEDWTLPSDTFQDTIQDYLYTKSMQTVRYEFVDAEILNIVPVIEIYAEQGYALSQTQTDVETVIREQFTLGDTVKLGTLYKYSNLVRAIDDLESVNHIRLTLTIKQTGDSGKLSLTPIKPGTVKVYGTVDGTSQLLAVDVNTTSSSEVLVATGDGVGYDGTHTNNSPNDTYAPYGMYNGQVSYKAENQERYLWYNVTKWIISNSIGGIYFGASFWDSSSLEGTYGNNGSYTGNPVVAFTTGGTITNTFESVDSNHTATGGIDYTTGVYSVTFTPDDVSDIYIRYEQDEGGDLVLLNNNQICKYEDDSMIVNELAYT